MDVHNIGKRIQITFFKRSLALVAEILNEINIVSFENLMFCLCKDRDTLTIFEFLFNVL